MLTVLLKFKFLNSSSGFYDFQSCSLSNGFVSFSPCIKFFSAQDTCSSLVFLMGPQVVPTDCLPPVVGIYACSSQDLMITLVPTFFLLLVALKLVPPL